MGRRAEGSLDLHCHSTFSDGSYGVGDLVGMARKLGIAALAVTDHDSLSQLSEVRRLSRELGYPVLAGVEASAFDRARGRKVHVLAFGLEATPDGSGPLERVVSETLAARVANTLWQAWTLERAGVGHGGRPLSMGAVLEAARGSTGVYKQHVMEALCGLDYTDGAYQELYVRLFKKGGLACRDIEYPDAAEVVRAIREQGGTAVLAHPGQTCTWEAIPELVAAGLEGIEAFHPDHGDGDVGLALCAAREFGLFVTGGSDYHGRFGAPASLGAGFVTPEEAGERVLRLLGGEASLR